MNLSGVFPALVTPFDASGELALDKMRANISALNRTGLAGYLVNGSTAECVFMTRAEMEQVLAAVREAAAPGRILIAGTEPSPPPKPRRAPKPPQNWAATASW
jgi:dihydrodipicolinate synthase/N-acetylneuraminate lyase